MLIDSPLLMLEVPVAGIAFILLYWYTLVYLSYTVYMLI